MWKDKGNIIAKIIFKTNKVGRSTLLDFKTYKSREPGRETVQDGGMERS